MIINDRNAKPSGAKAAAVTTAVTFIIVLIGAVIIMWLIFGREISRTYDGIFVLPSARERASAYISDKYGFIADIVSEEVPVNPGTIFMPSDRSDHALFYMSYNGRNFWTAVNYKDDKAPICDTYQLDDIESAVSNAIDACVPWKVKLVVEQSEPLVRKDNSGIYGFYHVFFDGTDWSDLKQERPLKITVYYSGTDISEKDFEPLKALGLSALIESYSEDGKIGEEKDLIKSIVI